MNNKLKTNLLIAILAIFLPIGAYSYKKYAPHNISSPKPQQMITIAEAEAHKRQNKAVVLSPKADSQIRYSSSCCVIDASNSDDGYVMVKYTGTNPKAKLQITKVGTTTYTYNLSPNGDFECFPLSEGSGSYTIKIFENIANDRYCLDLGQQIDVDIKNSTTPFLYPNQYIDFNKNSQAVIKGAELVADATNELDVVAKIYNYVINNISYDIYKAETVAPGYIADVDKTLSSKKGICLDYAALMVSMLRSQGIPTKLLVGYTSGGIYHAWLSTYITDVGWVDGIIYFDGQSWKRFDPTFAANDESDDSLAEYIGNASNYSVKYVY